MSHFTSSRLIFHIIIIVLAIGCFFVTNIYGPHLICTYQLHYILSIMTFSIFTVITTQGSFNMQYYKIARANSFDTFHSRHL